MAHLWIQDERGEWGVQPLEGDWVTLAADLRDRMYRPGEPHPDDQLVALMRVSGTNTEVWLLMAGRLTDVRVNGDDAGAGGLRVLCDRDEICLRGERRYFSTETLARVSPMPAMDPAPRCPRCHQAIATGTDAVRCPHCGIWHHRSEALPCWTYADTCANCPQPTDLEAGYRWTPE